MEVFFATVDNHIKIERFGKIFYRDFTCICFCFELRCTYKVVKYIICLYDVVKRWWCHYHFVFSQTILTLLMSAVPDIDNHDIIRQDNVVLSKQWHLLFVNLVIHLIIVLNHAINFDIFSFIFTAFGVTCIILAYKASFTT